MSKFVIFACVVVCVVATSPQDTVRNRVLGVVNKQIARCQKKNDFHMGTLKRLRGDFTQTAEKFMEDIKKITKLLVQKHHLDVEGSEECGEYERDVKSYVDSYISRVNDCVVNQRDQKYSSISNAISSIETTKNDISKMRDQVNQCSSKPYDTKENINKATSCFAKINRSAKSKADSFIKESSKTVSVMKVQKQNFQMALAGCEGTAKYPKLVEELEDIESKAAHCIAKKNKGNYKSVFMSSG